MDSTSKVTETRKKEIQYKLRIYVGEFNSQKKACLSLEGVSEATVIGILNGFAWEKISDNMWRTVEAQVGGTVDFSQLVETSNFQTLYLYYTLAKEEGASFAMVGNAGWGKSYAAKWYSSVNRKSNVYYLECAEYWNKKTFLQRLLLQMGENANGMTVGEMMGILLRELRKQDHPLIIIDEIDKLPDPVLKFFITLYNETNKTCGYVWQSTNAIEKRVIKGIEKGTVGFQELFSRIGASFIKLNIPTQDEVKEICLNSGITSTEDINNVINEVKDTKGDLRRVERNILKYRAKATRKKLTKAA